MIRSLLLTLLLAVSTMGFAPAPVYIKRKLSGKKTECDKENSSEDE